MKKNRGFYLARISEAIPTGERSPEFCDAQIEALVLFAATVIVAKHQDIRAFDSTLVQQMAEMAIDEMEKVIEARGTN